ncbi:MAG TPA: hypothetical protein PKE58_14655, partial [Acidobacteriota bacterium]|nr:hypothetical protein [Acidobacteriota bacterium]
KLGAEENGLRVLNPTSSAQVRVWGLGLKTRKLGAEENGLRVLNPTSSARLLQPQTLSPGFFSPTSSAPNPEPWFFQPDFFSLKS